MDMKSKASPGVNTFTILQPNMNEKRFINGAMKPECIWCISVVRLSDDQGINLTFQEAQPNIHELG